MNLKHNTKAFLKHLKLYGKWATVVGAAEGLGLAFSRILIENGFHVLMVDVDVLKLKSSVTDLGEYAKPLVLDMSKPKSTESLFEAIQETECRLVIYNAAYGPVKKFLDNSEDELQTYMELNANAPLKLAHKFARLWLNKEKAGFLVMSSLAGLRGTSLVAPYSATKGFDWLLMEALYYEFKETNLDFCACISGTIDTPNYRELNAEKSGVKPKTLSPDQVATEALQALGVKPFSVAGLTNRITNIVLKRVFGHELASRITNSTMRKMFAKQWGKGYQR